MARSSMSGAPRQVPSVSVVMPVRNARAYLERSMRGVLAQELEAGPFELVVVDNGSTDRSGEVAEAVRQDATRPVRLLHEGRPGAYVARNRALREARGELVALTDPDCVPADGWLARLTAPFADPRIEVVQGRTLPASRSHALDLVTAYEHHRNLAVFEGADSTVYFGQCNNLAVRRRTLEARGGFPERARGADALHVRSVAEGSGVSAVRYEPSATVRHLEVRTFRDHLAKARIYRASRRASGAGAPRALGWAARTRALIRAVRSGELSLGAVPPTLLLLVATQLYSRIPPRPFRRAPATGSAPTLRDVHG